MQRSSRGTTWYGTHFLSVFKFTNTLKCEVAFRAYQLGKQSLAEDLVAALREAPPDEARPFIKDTIE